MKKAYVILRKGFEYDDSVYNSQEGGHPSLVVFSKEDAKLKVKELNIKQFKECNLSEYSYEMDEILNVDYEEYNKFNEDLETKYGKPKSKNQWETFEDRLHPMANESEIEQYMKMVSFSFYEIIETDIDISSLRNEQINQILN